MVAGRRRHRRGHRDDPLSLDPGRGERGSRRRCSTRFEGNYQGFAIDGKAISIFAVPTATVTKVRIVSPIRVSNLSPGQDVILVGLEMPAFSPITASGISGQLRLQDCLLRASITSPQLAASVADSNVVFSNCSVLGGSNNNGMSPSLPGGNGLELNNSQVALYDSTVAGGNAYFGAHPNTPAGGRGGDGIKMLSNSLVFTTKSSVSAGLGGLTFWQPYPSAPTSYGPAGPNGTALALGFTTTNVAYALESTIGTVTGSGSFTQVPGSGRSSWVRPISDAQSPVAFSASGLDGDAVFLRFGTDSSFFLAAQGVWTVKGPSYGLEGSAPLGVLNSSGSLNGQLSLPAMAQSEVGRRYLAQGYAVDSSGKIHYATPSSVLSLNRDSQPDCNGNGIQDYWETIDDPTLDLNNNFIPDECEPGAVLYVDAHAAAGGTGMQSHPFQSIGEALAHAGSFGTVIVADGVYSGPDNRDLDLGTKCLVVRSANGPQNCIIDCDNQGRAFSIVVPGTLPSPTVIAGFTIQRGQAQEGGVIFVDNRTDVILRGNRFRGCVATVHGGALRITRSNVLVEDCVFRGNKAQSLGGAVAIGTSATPKPTDDSVVVSNCLVESNVASLGGGMYFHLFNLGGPFAETFTVSHSVIRGNTGGGIYARDTRIPLFIDNCLIAGNTASQGAGINHQTPGFLRVTNTTIADNHASLRGGGIEASGNGGATIEFHNSIVWGNTAPPGAGPQLFLPVGNIDYCLVEGGPALIAGGATWGQGNLTGDPLFENPGADYRLSGASPAIDAGNNALVPADRLDLDGNGNTIQPVPHDLDGATRHVDVPTVPDTGMGAAPIVDMGSYERQT